MAAAAALAAGAGRLTYRWSSTPGWSPGHWTWLAGGALIGRTLYTVVTAPAVKNYALIPSVIAITIGTVIIAGMTYLLARLHQQIKHRTAGQPTEPEPTA